jgi:protein-S-isoprenylcysteine O-methyltransferase Ste14
MFRRLKAPTVSSLGLQKLAYDLMHRRYRFRQFVGIAFLFVLTFLGAPAKLGELGRWLYYAGVAITIPGMLIRLWASGHVKKDKALATSGPYGYVRHPLYVGNHLITFGFCLASGLWWSLPAWLAIGLIFYPGTIQHEDEVLHRLFGKSWEDWRARTHALIPRLTPYTPGQKGEWSFSQSLRVNGEPVIILILVLCLYFLSIGLH